MFTEIVDLPTSTEVPPKMLAMMLPSELPAFLKSRRRLTAVDGTHSGMAPIIMVAGYFAVWQTAGMGIYTIGVMVARAEMQSMTSLREGLVVLRITCIRDESRVRSSH